MKITISNPKLNGREFELQHVQRISSSNWPQFTHFAYAQDSVGMVQLVINSETKRVQFNKHLTKKELEQVPKGHWCLRDCCRGKKCDDNLEGEYVASYSPHVVDER